MTYDARDPVAPTALPRPFFIARVAALPARVIDELRPPDLGALLDRLRALDAAVADAGLRLSDELFAAVGREEDRKVRRQLLQLRRALFHGQLPAAAATDGLQAALPAPLWAAVGSAISVVRTRDEAAAACRDAYARAVTHGRRRLQAAAGDPDFQKGLLLSSRALSASLPRYRRAAPERFTSREDQIERGVLRYLTRAVMKATPFARFCAVAAGALEDSAAHDPRGASFTADPTRKVGFVRLNKALYAAFWAHLKTRPAVRAALAVDLNPTLERTGGQLRFLAAVRGREVFQRVTVNDALDATLELVRAHPRASLGSLATALAAQPGVEASEAEAREYLDALIACGLLRFRSYVPEQVGDWDVPLRRALAGLDDPHARRVADVLAEVRALADEYAAGDVDARRAAAERMSAALRAAAAELGMSGHAPFDLPVFEDAATAATLSVPSTRPVRDALALLAEWVRLTQPLGHPRPEQATMRHFYDTRYGAAGCVPLLQFYEEFYRDHFKAHLQKEMRLRQGGAAPELDGYDFGNPFGLERVGLLRAATWRLRELLRSRWAEAPGAHAVHIDADAVRAALGPLADDGASGHCRSASAFAQLALPEDVPDAAAIVLPHGQYYVGFGKYFSRFLYMLPEEARRRVYADNVALAGEHRLAEICGDAHFNANLHPTLLPWEISYPTGESGAHDGQLRGGDLDVAPDPDDRHALVLVDRSTGARVLPVDLGFLNSRMRPPLYQLLIRFSPGASFNLLLPETLTPPAPARVPDPREADVPPQGAAPTAGATDAGAVLYRPRFVFGGRLVLARRCWTVPGALMPRPHATEDDAEYFVRVDRWRRAHGIPEEVYLRVIPERSPAADTDPRRPHPAPGAEAVALGAGATPADERADAGAEAPADAAPAAPPDETVAPVAGRRAAERGSRDWLKPQYMDFRSPLLVRLFARLPGALRAFRLQLEERYPDGPALPRFAGEGYVSELVFNVDLPARGGHSMSPRPDVRSAAAEPPVTGPAGVGYARELAGA